MLRSGDCMNPFALAAVVVLGGCVPLPPIPNLAATHRTVTIGAAGGYQLSGVDVAVPADACSSDAFVDGFKESYISRWDLDVGTWQGIADLAVKRNPGDTKAAWNLSLYRGKQFKLDSSIRHPTSYDSVNLTSSNYAVSCIPNSFQRGKTAGDNAAADAVAALHVQERH